MKHTGILILRNILLDVAIFVLACFALQRLLGVWDLSLRQWVKFAAFVFATIGAIVGVIQLLWRIGKKSMKVSIVFSALFIVLCLFYWRPFLFSMALSFPNEYVTERDGNTYVVELVQWHHTNATYYDYKNFFIRGQTPRIEEFYRYGDPQSNDPPTSAKYYDEDGRLTGELAE